jgi:GntR family transcriptional regulator, transcriptional repressor for pyruvate dehydrogenase complex
MKRVAGDRSPAQQDERGARPRPGPDLPIGKVKPAYVQVSEQLRDLILSGWLQEGERLPAEDALAAQFGASRSTVREALRLLSSERLVTTVRGVNGGTFVTPPTMAGVGDYLQSSLGILLRAEAVTTADMIEVRELLEPRAARALARTGDPGHVSVLEDLLAETMAASPDDNHAQQELSLRFHLHVAEGCGNTMLQLLIPPIFLAARARHKPGGQPAKFWKQVGIDHQRIVAAIRCGDADLAEDEMRQHVNGVGPFYEQTTPRPAAAPG